MNRTIEYWTVQKILNLLSAGNLNYKPNIQRQFIYNPEQQQQVIMSIKKGFVASSLVIEMEAPGSFVLLDGKQRVNSIIGFINRAFNLDSFYFDNRYRTDRPNPNDRYLCPNIITEPIKDDDPSDSAILLRFTFPVVIYSDMTNEERLTLFNVINTTGEKLNTWELINGRYPSGLLLDMRANYFNEILQTNTTTLNTNNINVKVFEKYFGTHEVNRGELYIKVIEKLYELYGGNLNDQPYEVIDGITIKTKNYNKLCKFVEEHNSERFSSFADVLIQKLKVFYEMFKDVNNLGILKEACFRISEYKFFCDHKQDFLDSDSKKAALGYLIAQYINSDIKAVIKDHEKYFEEVLLPTAFMLPDDFRTTLDTKRFYTSADKERIFISNPTLDASTMQVRCSGVMNDGVTPCGCGKWLRKDECTVDHKVPWILGGKTDDENAQLLCRECNSAKGSRIISDLLHVKGIR